MRYLLLAYPDVELPPASRGPEADDLTGWPRAAGAVLAGGPLRAAAAATVRLPAGDLVPPGEPGAGRQPAAPTGFWLVEARDLNHAVRLASQVPSVTRGCVHVHPLSSAGSAPDVHPLP